MSTYALLKRNRYIYLTLYLIANFYFACYYSVSGYLGGDFSRNYTSNSETLLISFFLILFSWYFFIKVFFFLERIKFLKLSEVNSSFLDAIFLVLAIIHIYGLLNGFISPSSDVVRSNFYLAFNYIFSVDVLLLVYLFYKVRQRTKIYFLICFLTVFIYLYSGRTSIFIYLLALFNLSSFTRTGKINLALNFNLIIIACLIFPFFRSLKHYMLLTVISDQFTNMSFIDGFISFWSKNDFVDMYVRYFNETLERFQHVSNVSFVIDNVTSLNGYLANYDFSLIYPTTKRIIENLLGYPNVPYQFYKLMGAYISNGETFDWNTPTGIPSLFYLENTSLVVYVCFSLLLIFLSVSISKIVDRRGFLLELTFLSMLLFILHGWINDFIVYTSSLLLFYFIISFVRFFVKKCDHLQC